MGGAVRCGRLRGRGGTGGTAARQQAPRRGGCQLTQGKPSSAAMSLQRLRRQQKHLTCETLCFIRLARLHPFLRPAGPLRAGPPHRHTRALSPHTSLPAPTPLCPVGPSPPPPAPRPRPPPSGQVLMLPNFSSFPGTALTLEFWMWSVDGCRAGVPFSYATGASVAAHRPFTTSGKPLPCALVGQAGTQSECRPGL